MIWLPQTTGNSTYFDQSLEIRGIESRLYLTLMIFLKEFFKNVDFENKSADNKKVYKITQKFAINMFIIQYNIGKNVLE